jgi:hypothetical protein
MRHEQLRERAASEWFVIGDEHAHRALTVNRFAELRDDWYAMSERDLDLYGDADAVRSGADMERGVATVQMSEVGPRVGDPHTAIRVERG